MTEQNSPHSDDGGHVLSIRFDQRSLRRTALTLLGFWVLFSLANWLFTSAAHFLFLILMAWLMSIAMEPAVAWFANHGLKRGLGSGLVLLLVLAGSIAFAALFGGIFFGQSVGLVTSLPQTAMSFIDWLNHQFGTTINASNILSTLSIGPAQIAGVASDLAGGILGFLVLVFGGIFDLLTIFVFGFYLSAEGPRLRRVIGSWLPERMQIVFITVWDIAVTKTGGFVVSKIVLAGMSAVAHVTAFYLIGVPYWLPMGIFAGIVSQFIPSIGTYIGIIIPAIFTVFDNPTKVLWIVAFATVYQQIESYVFTPRVSRATMDVHPAIALAAVFVGVELFGLIGAIIGIPLAAAILAIVETYRQRYQLVPELKVRTKGEKAGSDEFSGNPMFVIPAGKPLSTVTPSEEPPPSAPDSSEQPAE
ncbi:MAG: AI-2E family transporter [Actinomycetes bacterium]